ncbi:MAG: archease [Candidatus Parvarchaeota archaeon]|nr:archease [Candidatus Parvarchaeota archaeon]
MDKKRGRYKFLDNLTSADVAFEAYGGDLNELLENSAYALENIMVDKLEKIRGERGEIIEVKAGDIEQLLYNFLHELIVLKDVKLLVFSRFNVNIRNRGGIYSLKCMCKGSKINPKVHEMIVDVKGISMHKLGVELKGGRYRAVVVVDV